MQFAVCKLQCALLSGWCAVCRVLCGVRSLKCAVFGVLCAVRSLKCAVCGVQCEMGSVYWAKVCRLWLYQTGWSKARDKIQ